MDLVPNTGTAVIIIVAFLLPGFAVVLLQERTFKSADDPTELDRLLRVFWYSGWAYALLAGVALALDVTRSDIVDFYRDHHSDPALLVLVGTGLVLAPAIVIEEVTRIWFGSELRKSIFERLGVNARHTEPTGWDFFMRQRREAFVRVIFADSEPVLGYYGPDSFAAYAKDGGDLFLERVYSPNNSKDQWFGDEIPNTCGVWVKPGDALRVEFYTPGREAKATKSPPAAIHATLAILLLFLSASATAIASARRAWARRATPDVAPAEAPGSATAPASTEEEELANEQREEAAEDGRSQPPEGTGEESAPAASSPEEGLAS